MGGGDVMPESEVTLGEVARSLESLETRINRKFDEVTRRLDNLEFVPRREFEIQMQAHAEDIKELKDGRQWLQRTVVGAVLIAVLSPVVQLLMTR